MSNKQEKPSEKPSLFARNILVLFDLCLVINIFARTPAFCDFYTDRFFGILSYPLLRLSGLAPFSVGEWAIGFAVLFLLLTAVFSVLLIFLRKKKCFKAFAGRFIKSFFVFLLIVAAVMTFNCSIPYGCSKLYINDKKPSDYGFDELLSLYNNLVISCNELSVLVERDENGYAVYSAEDGQIPTPELVNELHTAMLGLSDRFPRLSGYYPAPKGLLSSIIMFETGTIGVYFPFTMESNYSRYLALVHFPATVCHEYSHLKGYMYEDEANFLGFLACMESDDPYLRYSGSVNSLLYVVGDVLAAIENPDYYEIFLERAVPLKESVKPDTYTYTEDSLEKAMELSKLLERKTGFSEEDVSEISDSFTKGYADYYNVTLNYDEVTYRLLQYCDETGKLP